MRVADVATTMCRYLEYFHASKVYMCMCVMMAWMRETERLRIITMGSLLSQTDIRTHEWSEREGEKKEK